MIKYTSIGKLIAKLDNDFGIDNSDWIPRLSEWAIAAMADLGIYENKEMKIVPIPVEERIVPFPCDLSKFIGLFSSKGCLITRYNPISHAHQSNYATHVDISHIKRTVIYDEEGNVIQRRMDTEAIPLCNTACDYIHYIPISGRAVELTRDDHKVWLMYMTAMRDENGDVLVPDNEVLLEAIAWYCFWKILGRGTKHIVYSLTGKNDLNPFWLYRNIYRLKAINEYSDMEDGIEGYKRMADMWSESFYNTIIKYI